MASGHALHLYFSTSIRVSPAAAQSRRRQRVRSAQTLSSSSISTVSTSTSATSNALSKPILILFDLDNAPIPSHIPACAVVSVLTHKMVELLGVSPSSEFTVRAAAFANEATVRRRPDLAASLSSAGVTFITVPATRNAADSMVVSCAAKALSEASGGGSGGGSGGDSGSGGGGGGLSGLVFCSADNYFSGFLRYASYKGVRTFVAGDFDNNRARVKGGTGGQRRRKRGEKKKSSESTSTSTISSSNGSDGDDELNAANAAEEFNLAPWRRKELPAAADGAALWRDVLIEARELLNR